MKKKDLLIVVVLLLHTLGTKAQNLIAVQNNSTPSFFASIDSAIIHAQNGDTIFMPGGNFALNRDISKRLHIIGVGHNPDSTLATNPTNIFVNSSLNLVTGASGGSILGVKLFGGLCFGTSTDNANVSNYTVGKCYVGAVTSTSNLPTNNLFYENIITNNGNIYFYGSINMSEAKSNYFYNNIITGGWGGYGHFSVYSIGVGSVFKNNIFINTDSYYHLMNVVYSTIENNIFVGALFSPTNPISNNILNNNLFVTSSSYYFWSNWNNTGMNNIFEQPKESIWNSQSGNSYSYTENYHLQPNCPGKNAGRDGTDIGIYGGAFPWKDGSIPYNPHVQALKIAPTTDNSGNLNVKIKVAAQDR